MREQRRSRRILASISLEIEWDGAPQPAMTAVINLNGALILSGLNWPTGCELRIKNLDTEFAGACSAAKFVVEGGGEEYDAPENEPNRKSRVGRCYPHHLVRIDLLQSFLFKQFVSIGYGTHSSRCGSAQGGDCRNPKTLAPGIRRLDRFCHQRRRSISPAVSRPHN